MTSMNRTERFDQAWSLATTIAFSVAIALAGALGLLLTGWLFLNLFSSQSLLQALSITEKTPWYFARAAGTVAYALLAASTLWGLLLSTRLLKDAIPANLSLALHNILSWLAVIFTGLHALALLWDSYYTYTLADLTVPFIGPYRPGWVGLGIIGFYLMFVTSLSFSFRKQMGQKRWRQLHYATFLVYLLATVHGLLAGTDSSGTLMLGLYWGSSLAVLAWTGYRFLAHPQPATSR
ncbi:MAG: ferric reductase-like transmembrane domain-containing protein [Anaerolineales bacterium]|nr:ferric reductase-like transmembrane domain-containing protein [Anaerolineales bacterium]